MVPRSPHVLASLAALSLLPLAAHASIIGQQANLNQSVTSGSPLHGVSGIATITGPTSIHVSNFTYNGGGIAVYFYLATADTAAAIPNGIQISPNILGSAAANAYTFPNPTTHEQLGNFDLTVPSTANIDLTDPNNPYNALSVWCLVARADFASNVFSNPPAPVPEPASGLLLLGISPLLLKQNRRPRET